MTSEISLVASLAALPQLGSSVVAIGTFDGVHRGHHYLLSQACKRAHGNGDAFVIITFTPNPQMVLRPQLRHFQLAAAPIKVALLRALEPDCIALLPFTREMAATSADAFMEALEGRLALREMWMGEDFAFGHKRSGNVAYLIARGQTSGFSVHVIPREGWRALPVSSTRIRQALAEGDIALANDLLGYPLRLLGTLRSSEGDRGDSALWVPMDQALPGQGRYMVEVAPPAPGGAPPRAGVLSIPATLPDDQGLCRLPLSLAASTDADVVSAGEVEVAVLARLDGGASGILDPPREGGNG